jgi:hypothetical protein
MRKPFVLVLVVSALAAAGLPAEAGATPKSFTFDANAQGWKVFQNGTQSDPEFSSFGGNPGGYIRGLDATAENGCPGAPCDYLFLYAPPVPAGTYTNNYGGAWSFDFGSQLPAVPGPYGKLLISDAAGNAVIIKFAVPSTPVFQHISGSLTEPGWTYCTPSAVCGPATQAQFKSVLTAATFTDIFADVDATGISGERYALDNFTLTDGPPLVVKKKCKKGKKLRKIHGKKKCVKKKKKKK